MSVDTSTPGPFVKPVCGVAKTTQRVRIVVIVMPDGSYQAAGWNGGAEGDLEEHVTEFAAQSGGDYEHGRIVYVDADVPLPEPPVVVEGKAQEAGES